MLVGDCPEAESFDRSDLILSTNNGPLSLDQKLGHLYEDALQLILLASARYELLEKNLQLQDGIHKTLGELDFLLRDRQTDELIHLELAVKFYLAVETSDGLQLPGPDARDNYFKKIERLRTHQLVLTEKFRQHLPEKYRKETITSQHLILGCLFAHISVENPAQPKFLNPSARRGRWLRQSELPAHFPDRRIEVIPKPLWPVAIDHLASQHLRPFQNESPLERCVMVKIEDHPKPVFVTPDAYPGGAYLTPQKKTPAP